MRTMVSKRKQKTGVFDYHVRGEPLDNRRGARSFFEKKCLSLSRSKLKCLLPVVVKKNSLLTKLWKIKCLIGPCGKSLFKKGNHDCPFESKLNSLLQLDSSLTIMLFHF